VTTIADLLTLLTREPGRPRITWYGDGGERVELSGAVLENWVNKTANLLVEEFDAEPGTRVLLDLPVHWRSFVWALATWRVGACVVLGERPPAEVVVTDRPSRHAGGGQDLVAVAMSAFARRFDGELPAGAIDAASAVMTYSDALEWSPPRDPAAPALSGTGPDLAHSALVAREIIGGRRLLRLSNEGPDLRTALEWLLAGLAGDGSAVVVDERHEPWSEDRIRRLTDAERIA
jgi:uncharacterized protein (TIGR03089 family)